jgi:hypothetical protein
MELNKKSIDWPLAIFHIVIGVCVLALVVFSPCYTFVDLPLYTNKGFSNVEHTTIFREALIIGKNHLALNWCGFISNIGACIILLLCIAGVAKFKTRILILLAVLHISGFIILMAQLNLPDWVYSRWKVTMHFAYPMFIIVNALFGFMWIRCMQKNLRAKYSA